MANCNNPAVVKAQYADTGNLTARVSLHQLYNTNRQGWADWVFEQYALKPRQTILELGCGSGGMWRGKAGRLPDNIRLVLSDLSEGMLRSARKATGDMGFIDYRVIDAQDIPFPDGSFDIVIANHMLYHVPDISKALSEITRVLKPGGTLYATTMGANNMRELDDILKRFDPRLDFTMGSVISAFGLERGEERLRAFFNSVQVQRYEDSLHVTDSGPLVDYVLSSQSIGTVGSILTGDNIEAFGRYISQLIAEKGAVDIQKDAGMLIAAGVRK